MSLLHILWTSLWIPRIAGTVHRGKPNQYASFIGRSTLEQPHRLIEHPCTPTIDTNHEQHVAQQIRGLGRISMAPPTPRKTVVKKRPVKKTVSRRTPVSSTSTDPSAKTIDGLLNGSVAPADVERAMRDPTKTIKATRRKVIKDDPRNIDGDTTNIEPYKTGGVTRTRKTNRKYDWDAIKEIYVEGEENEDGTRTYLTIEEIGKRYDIQASRIREHSAAERWREQRAVFQNKMDFARQQRRAKELAQEAVEFDTSSLRIAKLGQAIIAQRLGRVTKDAIQFEQVTRPMLDAIIKAGGSVKPSDLRGPIYYEEMRALAQAAQAFQQMGRIALGEDVERGTEMPEPGEAPVLDIRIELMRDDDERTAKLLEAAAQAGLFKAMGIDGTEDEFFDAEIVDDDATYQPTNQQVAITGNVDDSSATNEEEDAIDDDDTTTEPEATQPQARTVIQLPDTLHEQSRPVSTIGNGYRQGPPSSGEFVFGH